MDTSKILAAIDSEIGRLTIARNLLSGADTEKRRGRPPAATKDTTAPASAKASKRKPLSAEARARIAAAQKARWAKTKKAAPK